MPADRKKSSHWLWLALLTAVFLSASVNSLAECTPVETEIKSEATDTSDDDDKTVSRVPCLPASVAPFPGPAIHGNGLSPLANSDAYSSLILHGPPATPHPA